MFLAYHGYSVVADLLSRARSAWVGLARVDLVEDDWLALPGDLALVRFKGVELVGYVRLFEPSPLLPPRAMCYFTPYAAPPCALVEEETLIARLGPVEAYLGENRAWLQPLAGWVGDKDLLMLATIQHLYRPTSQRDARRAARHYRVLLRSLAS